MHRSMHYIPGSICFSADGLFTIFNSSKTIRKRRVWKHNIMPVSVGLKKKKKKKKKEKKKKNSCFHNPLPCRKKRTWPEFGQSVAKVHFEQYFNFHRWRTNFFFFFKECARYVREMIRGSAVFKTERATQRFKVLRTNGAQFPAVTPGRAVATTTWEHTNWVCYFKFHDTRQKLWVLSSSWCRELKIMHTCRSLC